MHVLVLVLIVFFSQGDPATVVLEVPARSDAPREIGSKLCVDKGHEAQRALIGQTLPNGTVIRDVEFACVRADEASHI